MNDWALVIDHHIDEQVPFLAGLRRRLHADPEPSREEFRTTAELARLLGEAGVPHQVMPSGRGLIAGPAPESLEQGRRVVAFRADLDALRLQDAKDVAYRSAHDGLMHACGHDAHATMALGAALALHRSREALPPGLAWRALFQPAEEVAEGAREMIAAGAMEGIGTIVALHVDPEIEVGRVGLRTGPLTAACLEVHITVRGRGGHAARPHLAIDPIAAAVQFVSAVYQTVPRSVDARDPVVISFGAFRGGQQANVIPDRTELRGTIRTFSPAAQARVEATLAALARGVGEATGADLEIETHQETPSVVNDPAVAEVVGRAAAEVVGPEHVLPIERPSLGGEDFAWYLAHAPGCLLRLGAASALPWPSLHSPLFDIDERALAIGARVLARCAVLLA